ncbi:MAG: acyl-CoA dehydrogenase [Pseudomonadota bacterium]
MTHPLLNDRDIRFLLHEFLDTGALLARPRYAEHSREVFDATLETARKVAETFFANHNAKGDAHEPTFDGENVHLIPETKAAWDAFAAAGFLAAHYDFEDGGMQMPETVLRTVMAYMHAANVATTGYPFLALGAANLIHAFGTEAQKACFLPPMREGRFAGTMAMTEPGQGSALADLRTHAVAQADGSYRLFGQKMFISGGDQPLTENIVHMVLARIKDAPPGVRGISLFICPKFLVNADGSLGARNDVALAGLLHKMGWRNTTSTVLSFGEKEGAVAYLVGDPHKGLGYMFQMMNEARIAVGLGAAALAYQGYNCSLAYARSRPQGRLPSNKDPLSKQVNLIEHADVRRLLLAQKAYAEGALALCLYASSLFEDSRTAATEAERQQAFLLLDLLTPVVKSWPSKYGMKANEHAIQVLGGSGYIREYPVEQYYRDQRLNPIHEGAEAIHGIDLLGRKVVQGGGAGYQAFLAQVETAVVATDAIAATREFAGPLRAALRQMDEVTSSLTALVRANPDLGLANATVYLDLFGRLTLAWIWARQATLAAAALERGGLPETEAAFYQGKLQAARYFFRWELPESEAQAALLRAADSTCLDMQDAWF